MITLRKRQRGFGIAAAIFILLVLAVLGAFIVSVSTTQHTAAALDIQGTEAYRSARSGIEWGVFRVITDTACFVSPNNIGAVSGMTVTVQCASTGPLPEVGAGTIYTITATACNLPNAGPSCPGVIANPLYVERQITVMVER